MWSIPRYRKCCLCPGAQGNRKSRNCLTFIGLICGKKQNIYVPRNFQINISELYPEYSVNNSIWITNLIVLYFSWGSKWTFLVWKSSSFNILKQNKVGNIVLKDFWKVYVKSFQQLDDTIKVIELFQRLFACAK